MEHKIPHIIHYCWFGHNEKPEEVIGYIKSWKKFFPEFRIMEWNESNFDIGNSIPYVKEAYENKKWAFVADYVRLVVLEKYGGLYFDTDVQVLKSFDKLLSQDAFVGFESKDYVCTAVIACKANFWLIKEFKESYKEKHFLLENGKLNLNTNVLLLTELLIKYGLVTNGKEQKLNGLTIFPQYYFSANDFINIFKRYRKRSYSYHHCSASWYAPNNSQGIAKRIYHYLLGVGRNTVGTATLYHIRHK